MMSVFKHLFTVFAFCILSGYSAFGQVRFEHYNTNTGLTNNSVRWISQDQNGFLWFGTLNGLNRFDGHKIKSYPLFDKNSTATLNNRIIQIHQSKDSLLWVITYDKKVHVLDLTTEETTSFPYNIYPYETTYKAAHPASYITETQSGAIWFLNSEGGCIRVKRNNNGFVCDTYNCQGLLQKRDVNFVHQDKKGGIWIGSIRGITYLPSDTTSFKSNELVNYYYANKKSFTSCLDNGHEIWFGTNKHGIIRYSLISDSFISHEPFLTDSGIISTIVANDKNQILIGTMNNGLYFVDNNKLNTNRFIKHKKQFYTPQIKDIYCCKSGKFWFTSNLRGVTMFDPETTEFRHFPLSPQFRENIREPEKIIFFEDSNNNLWIGNYGGGLFRFDKDKMDFEHYYYQDTNPASLSSNYILSLFEDASKNLWIGTLNGGINKVSLRKKEFIGIQPDPTSLLNYKNEVRAVWSDSCGNTWIGTKGSLIQCYDSTMNRVWDSRDFNSVSKKIKGAIYCLYGDRDNNLWVGTKGDGIYILQDVLYKKQHVSPQITSFKSEYRTTKSISNNNVYDIIQDNKGQYWTANYFGGLNLIRNPLTNPRFKHFWVGNDSINCISDDRVRCIFQDSKNNLWIGTVDGINFLAAENLTSENKNFIHIKLKGNDPAQVVSNDIMTISENNLGQIMVGTFGSGLFVLENSYPAEGQIKWKQYTTSDGLISNVVYGIACNRTNDVWITTDNGISRLDISMNSIRNFMGQNMLGVNNVLSENCCKGTAVNGLVCGTTGGFIYFNTNAMASEENRFPVIITSFELFDEEVRPAKSKLIDTAIEVTKRLTLPYDQNFFSFEFSTPGLDKPNDTRYQYILENYEERWNHAVNGNRAVYKNVNAGRYIFKVRRGNSAQHEASIEVIIEPPLWQTPLAYTIYIMGALFIISLIIYLLANELKLRQKIALEKKLSEDKIRFYTNVSHELKTPLSLILAPAERLANTPEIANSSVRHANLIRQNAVRLQGLIEQLLDFRKIQKEGFRLKVANHDIIAFCQNIYNSFVPLAQDQNITFEFVAEKNHFNGWFDTDCLEKIVFNLLSNAFKHTPPGNGIQFIIDITEKDYCHISVRDEGEGIVKEDLSKIFDRFSTFSTTYKAGVSSSGIGLSIVKELVECHKGKISVQSKYGKGSLFIIKIPVNRANYKKHELVSTDVTTYPAAHSPVLLPPAINTVETTPVRTRSRKTKPLALIIEDNKELNSFIAESLSPNYKIITAINGNEGFKLIKSKSPDIVVCDVMLPGLTGIEITQKVKSNFNTCHIPIILLTARSTEEQKLDGITNGADDYITKPFNLMYLEKRMENILHQRKLLKEKLVAEPFAKPNTSYASKQDQEFIDNVVRLTEGKHPHKYTQVYYK